MNSNQILDEQWRNDVISANYNRFGYYQIGGQFEKLIK